VAILETKLCDESCGGFYFSDITRYELNHLIIIIDYDFA